MEIYTFNGNLSGGNSSHNVTYTEIFEFPALAFDFLSVRIIFSVLYGMVFLACFIGKHTHVPRWSLSELDRT